VTIDRILYYEQVIFYPFCEFLNYQSIINDVVTNQITS